MPVANRWGLPDLGLGVGLRGPHIAQFMAERPPVGWLEVITDNHLINQGYLRHVLEVLGETYPLVLHGVTLNIGSTDPLDVDYVRQVGRLADEIGARWVGDHLCWTGVAGRQSHDLLPVPYTRAALHWTADRIKRVQDVWGRPLVLENPSSYLQFAQSEMPEWEFMAQLLHLSDCGLLLDVNNVFVSAHNHGYDPQRWLDAVPWSRVCQIHVAGHTTLATHKLDTHIGPVSDEVWQLYGQAWQRAAGRSTLLEWDDEIPDLPALLAEMAKAKLYQLDDGQVPVEPPPPQVQPLTLKFAPRKLQQTYQTMLARIEKGQEPHPLAVHGRMYALRLRDALREDYPLTAKWLGQARFDKFVAQFVARHPSRHWALELYGAPFAPWLASQRGCRVAAEIAALEWARVQAKLAAEPVDGGPQALAGLDGPALGAAELVFAPAVRELPMGLRARRHCGLEANAGQRWVRVSRARWQVWAVAMHPAEAALWQQLWAGKPVLAAMQAVVEATPRFGRVLQRQIGAWLADWVRDGAVVGVR